MSDENKIAETNEPKKVIVSKEFKDFLIVAGGSFLGVFCALSLFCLIHSPAVKGCNPPPPPKMPPMEYCHKKMHGHHKHFRPMHNNNGGFMPRHGEFKKDFNGRSDMSNFKKHNRPEFKGQERPNLKGYKIPSGEMKMPQKPNFTPNKKN